MSDAVNMPCLMMMTLIVSEESLVRDRHTHTDICLVDLKLFQSHLRLKKGRKEERKKKKRNKQEERKEDKDRKHEKLDRKKNLKEKKERKPEQTHK